MFPLLDDDHPHLSVVVPPFEFSSDDDVRPLVEGLKNTMAAYRAVGLAANQCGFSTRVFVMDIGGVRLTCFNPEIEVLGKDTETHREGCLSFPGIHLTLKRFLLIRLHYQDETGEKKSIDLSGWPARVAQHETDHLNGIVFTSKVSKMKLALARKKAAKHGLGRPIVIP